MSRRSVAAKHLVKFPDYHRHLSLYKQGPILMYHSPETVAPADKTRSLVLGIRREPLEGRVFESRGGHGSGRRLEVTDGDVGGGWMAPPRMRIALRRVLHQHPLTPAATTTTAGRPPRFITELTRFDALSAR